MADTVDSKSAVARRVGSSPTIRIYFRHTFAGVSIFLHTKNTLKSCRHTFDTPIFIINAYKWLCYVI